MHFNLTRYNNYTILGPFKESILSQYREKKVSYHQSQHKSHSPSKALTTCFGLYHPKHIANAFERQSNLCCN